MAGAVHTAGDLAILIFLSIALYNVVELQLLVLSIFNKYTGLYFWSIIVANWGVAFNSVGYLLRHLDTGPGHLHATLILIGWSSMITGQSLVLYSRLHLLTRCETRLHLVLGMIITNSIVLGVPIWVLVYGTNSDNPSPYEAPYKVFEKLQLIGFFIQELIISSLYIKDAVRMWQIQRNAGNVGFNKVMIHLILVNILVIILDVTIISLEFTNQYDVQTAWKALVYSIKLKVEFGVLNQVATFSRTLRLTGRLDDASIDAQSTELAFERYLMNTSSHNTIEERPNTDRPK